MCHYLGAGLHGKQKRVKAQSESSKSVVNSVLISREMPVFPGFLEIIRVVMINDIAFKGKRSVEWSDVEKYLRQYVGDIYRIAETEDIIYIGTDLPDEYSGSNYTKHIKGTIAKAKANAVQAIPEMIEIATSKTFEDNKKNKHSRHAKNGWYRYDTRFALPVYDENGDVERYNVFSARLLIRHASSGKMYLYDVLEIKKETSKSCQE